MMYHYIAWLLDFNVSSVMLIYYMQFNHLVCWYPFSESVKIF